MIRRNCFGGVGVLMPASIPPDTHVKGNPVAIRKSTESNELLLHGGPLALESPPGRTELLSQAHARRGGRREKRQQLADARAAETGPEKLSDALHGVDRVIVVYALPRGRPVRHEQLLLFVVPQGSGAHSAPRGELPDPHPLQHLL